MSIKKHTTLNDIAKELNISKVAVSKALRDHPDISTHTKTMVADAARRLGYVPNYMARNLSSRRSNTIGLVVPKIAHHFFAEAIESIYETANLNNYEVIMSVSRENAENEVKHIQTLLSMRVDGILISVSENTKNTQIFETVKRHGIPLVFFDRVIHGLDFSCVTTDDEQGAFDAVSYLVNAGYLEIAHIGGFTSTNIGKDRMHGYRRAVNTFNLNIPDKWILEGGFAEKDGYQGLMQIFKSGKIPEVIFTVTYPVALGVILAAEELNIKIPEDLNLICFGGSNYNHFVQPSLSFVNQPVADIGKNAVDLLVDHILNPDRKAQNVNLPAELVVCETCLSK